MNEFEKIYEYFVAPYSNNELSNVESTHSYGSNIESSQDVKHSTQNENKEKSCVILGIGDDCAELKVPSGMSLLVSIDTLEEGVHFIKGTSADLIAERSVAVSISDLAAMGAKAKWLTLALSTDHSEATWWESFSIGLKRALTKYNIQLIGGDTTYSGKSGGTTVSMQVHGLAPHNTSLKRSGAQVDDLIFVSASLGDGAASLAYLTKSELFNSSDDGRSLVNLECANYLHNRFYRPSIAMDFAYALRECANSAIDISDGLLADLGHICKQSQVCAEIDEDLLPISHYILGCVDRNQAKDWALTGGDDYRLCFTLPSTKRKALADLEKRFGISCAYIGKIVNCPKGDAPVVISSRNRQPFETISKGYQHF